MVGLEVGLIIDGFEWNALCSVFDVLCRVDAFLSAGLIVTLDLECCKARLFCFKL